MILKKVKITNYRQLQNVELDMQDSLTVLAGPNNSGTLSVLSPFPGCDAAGCHAFWRTAGIKHFHLIDTLILQGNIWIYKRI